jgi:DnaJ-class molecular chaperone
MAVQNTKNYYDALGVKKDADEKDIRQAFRKLAREYHPDLNPGDKGAEAKFKEINEANEVLSDPEDRKKYDKYGDDWKRADEIESHHGTRGRGRPYTWETGGGGFNSDMFGGFDDLLGGAGRRRSNPTPAPKQLELDIDVSLEEAYLGTKRTVTITQNGQDRRIEVDIPHGVDTGSVVKIKPASDQNLRLKMNVQPHPRFKRVGSDLSLDVSMPLDDVALGAEIEVATMTGKVHLKIPAGSQNGQRIRLKSKGMPKLGDSETKGDLFVVLRPQLPKQIDDEEQKLFEQLRELRVGKE